MSTVSKSLAKGVLFEYQGVSYTVSPWTYDVQAEYEKYFIAKAYANVRSAKNELGNEYPEVRDGLRRDIDAGDYEFGKPLVMKSLNSVKNLKHLMFLSLAYGCKDTPSIQVTKDLITEITDKEDKFNELAEAMAEANRDPNLSPEGELPVKV